MVELDSNKTLINGSGNCPTEKRPNETQGLCRRTARSKSALKVKLEKNQHVVMSKDVEKGNIMGYQT